MHAGSGKYWMFGNDGAAEVYGGEGKYELRGGAKDFIFGGPGSNDLSVVLVTTTSSRLTIKRP